MVSVSGPFFMVDEEKRLGKLTSALSSTDFNWHPQSSLIYVNWQDGINKITWQVCQRKSALFYIHLSSN